MKDAELFYMREAIKLAEMGMRKGEGGPFGAVVVRGDEIIGKGWNRVLATNDPTAHAEIVAIRSACSNIGQYWLEGSRVYVNCEPCPMCLAAMYWARVETVVFAATRSDAARLEFDDAYIYEEICRPVSERSLKSYQCLRDESLKVMQLWPDMDLKQSY